MTLAEWLQYLMSHVDLTFHLFIQQFPGHSYLLDNL